MQNKVDEQALEAVLKERQAEFIDLNGSVTDVSYNGLDLLNIFMQINFGKIDFNTIHLVLSKMSIENKKNKNFIWKYKVKTNVVPGLIKEDEVWKLVYILCAHNLIERDESGLFRGTSEGKEVRKEAIKWLDSEN